MRLLIVTQVIDTEHPVLGFFHAWVTELAKDVEHIELICLYEGANALPANVRLHSLGKQEVKRGRFGYALRFLQLVWRYRNEYDVVFVHMNQEYVLLAGVLWRAMGKRIYMWRNHYAGSWLTDVAAAFCAKIFCTSRYSYTAKYRKTVPMPVGVPVERFAPDASVRRNEKSILFLARMSPSKDPLLLVEALGKLRQEGIEYTATFAGSPLPEHEAYYRRVLDRAEQLGLMGSVRFIPAVSGEEAIRLYRSNSIFVNCSPSGMFDKTIFEAAASGCVVLASSRDYEVLVDAALSFNEKNPVVLTERLLALLTMPATELEHLRTGMQGLADSQSLERLAARVKEEISADAHPKRAC